MFGWLVGWLFDRIMLEREGVLSGIQSVFEFEVS